MIPVWYHEAARQELLGAVSYFEARVRGLGNRFLADIRKAEDQISRLPESTAELVPSVRKCRLRKFPYSLIYAIYDKRVVVLAVAHHRRVPFYWVDRLIDSSEAPE